LKISHFCLVEKELEGCLEISHSYLVEKELEVDLKISLLLRRLPYIPFDRNENWNVGFSSRGRSGLHCLRSPDRYIRMPFASLPTSENHKLEPTPDQTPRRRIGRIPPGCRRSRCVHASCIIDTTQTLLALALYAMPIDVLWQILPTKV
jgi:hypothetical protein